jgi:arabinogalactan oligomer/maltooligosaccharide transport system permease protein
MVGWSGRKTTLTILFFLAPTIVGLLLCNVYPILLNTYTSFTNRNKFRPNPNCEAALNGYLDPTCWPVFAEHRTTGLGTPYELADPWYNNYSVLVGELFSIDALIALLRIFVCLVPLIIAAVIDKRLDQELTRSIPTTLVYAGGLLGVVVLGMIIGLTDALDALMNTGDFLVVVLRTLMFVVLRVPLSFLLGLVLALILNDPKLPGKTFFRVALFTPWAASSVAILIALVWQFFFREQGTFNQVLQLFGMTGPVWLSDPVLAFGAVVAVDVWFSFGFFMISILGALQSIPTEMYEAADVDGASWWTQLTSITLPLIRSAILPAVVLTSISAFQMFGSAYAMTGGGPVDDVSKPGVTEFVMVYAYRQIFQSQNYGRATAFAVIIFIMLFSVTLWSLRLTRITKSTYES